MKYRSYDLKNRHADRCNESDANTTWDFLNFTRNSKLLFENFYFILVFYNISNCK